MPRSVQVTHSRRCTRAPRWVGCGDNRNQPRPARSGQVNRSGWGLLDAFDSDLRYTGKNVIVLEGRANVSLHSARHQTPAVESSALGLKNLASASAREVGSWQRMFAPVPNSATVHIAKARFSHTLPCRHTVEMGAGAFFRQGVTASVRGVSEGRFDVSPEISGQNSDLVVALAKVWSSSCRPSFGSRQLQKLGRAGSWDTSPDSPRRLVKGVHGTQRRWNWTKSLLAVRGPRGRAREQTVTTR